jgi:hypothetical protein
LGGSAATMALVASEVDAKDVTWLRAAFDAAG